MAILHGKDDFASQYDVEAVIVVSYWANFFTFLYVHVFDFPAQISNFLSIELLGNCIKKIHLLKHISDTVEFFFLFIDFLLVHYSDKILYFLEFATSEFFNALPEFLGLSFWKIQTHIGLEFFDYFCVKFLNILFFLYRLIEGFESKLFRKLTNCMYLF